MEASDRRFGGISGLALDGGRFIAVSDLGAVIRFDRPDAGGPTADIADLRQGPGPWGRKWSRDAESLALDPAGRGWWVGYEQNHSLWLYDRNFAEALANADLKRGDWRDNRGAEGLIADPGGLLVLAENGREAMRVDRGGVRRIAVKAGADVADASKAPDGSIWLLTRSKGLQGISQTVVPLIPAKGGFEVGRALRVPKGAFDNFEGMAIEALPDRAWRFWLLSDDGHRIMARTVLVALDYRPPGHNKSPAQGAGLLKKPAVESP